MTRYLPYFILMLPTVAFAMKPMSDDEIRRYMVDESLKTFSRVSACVCPYSKDLQGLECGERSLYFTITAEVDKPKCFPEDVKSYDIWGNRQELPAVYRINGNAFVTWTENIENFTTYNVDMVEYSNTDVRYVLCPQERSMDIDSPLDFEIAEFLLSPNKFTK